jgi:hypothetical protein
VSGVKEEVGVVEQKPQCDWRKVDVLEKGLGVSTYNRMWSKEDRLGSKAKPEEGG